MMFQKKINNILPSFLSAVVALAALLFVATPVAAQESLELPPQEYFRGTVLEVLETRTISSQDDLFIQMLQVQRKDTGQQLEVTAGTEFQPLNKQQLLKAGTELVLVEQTLIDGSTEVVVADVYRTNTVYWLLAIFVVVVVIIGGLRGATSFLGMFVSLIILLMYVVPEILSGSNPMMVGLLGSLLIGTITIYIAHGFSLKSHVALASMSATLLLVAGLAMLAVKSAQLVGLGSEEAYFLQFADTANINLQGLLLCGILLGALGVLDDITISQSSIVFELFDAKKKITWTELYERGLSVGKDHVASLVNTLVLAYVGANLPLFLLLVLNEQTPLWVTLNSDILIEEVIRTLAGSIGLVLAVPLSTFMAAQVVTRYEQKK